MKVSQFKDYSELPLFLNAEMVAKVLGVSPSSGYELMHEPGFPILKIGNRMVVPKEKFIQWVEQNTIGWPRRDPRHYRFAIPNAMWDYHLRPAEFVIFSYLCYHSSTSEPTLKEIAAGIYMTTSTVKKYLDSLIAKKLIGEDGTPVLKSKDKKFFTLPNEVFLLRLSPSAFVVYAYLLLIEDRRTHTCHPSYNTIATATGLAKNTAMKSVNTLLEMGLIAVESSSYFDKRGMKWKGNNLYTILPVRAAVDTFHQRQLRQLELDAERRRVIRQQQEYDRRHPRATLCATTVAEAALDPAQSQEALCAR